MKNNSIFQKDKGNFYKKMQQWIHSWKSGQAYGKMRVKLPTKNMESKIKKSIKEKITRMEELKITEKELGKTIMKRKSWAAPGIDGISSFWMKTLRSSWEKLATVMQTWIEDRNKVLIWPMLGKMVFIPKYTDLSREKD